MRLLISQSAAPTSVPLKNAIKGVACVKTSVLLGMQLKILSTKSCVHLCKFIVPSALAPLAVSLSRCQNGNKI